MAKRTSPRRRTISKKIREAVRQDYVYGLIDPEQLEEKHGVKRHTIGVWIRRYGWEEQQNEAKTHLNRESMLEKMQSKVVSQTNNLLDINRAAIQVVGTHIGERIRSGESITLTELDHMTKILSRCADTIKKIMPQASEEIAERILAEQEEINERLASIERRSSGNQIKAVSGL